MPFADERLETFATVCDCKSFTKAAEKLSLTQPAVSQHIRKIEEELNVKLFLRRKGDLVLSPEGEVVLLYAKRMRALCQTMLDSVKFSKSGLKKIRIGITHTQESGLMVEVLSRLAGTTDNVSITFITDNITNLYDMLENFEIDVAVIEEKPTKPNLNFVVLATDYLLCVMSPDNPLANQSAVTLASTPHFAFTVVVHSSKVRGNFVVDRGIHRFLRYRHRSGQRCNYKKFDKKEHRSVGACQQRLPKGSCQTFSRRFACGKRQHDSRNDGCLSQHFHSSGGNCAYCRGVSNNFAGER